MGKIIRNGIEFSGTTDTANNINYDNSVSSLQARTAQEAIDELTDSLEWKRIGSVTGDTVLNHDFTQYREIFLNCYLYGHSYNAYQLSTIALYNEDRVYTVVSSYNTTYGVSAMNIKISKTAISINAAKTNDADKKAN